MPQRILSEVQLPDFQDRPKKEGDILRTAEQLFMQFGYKRVTVEEICREAHVSKVTFYKYFSNKLAVLEDYLNERLKLGMETFQRISDAEASLQEKMQALVAMKQSAVSHFTPVFLSSLQSTDESVLILMEEWTRMGMDALKQFFQDAQERGEIYAEYSVDFLLHVWNVLGADARSEAITEIYGGDWVKLSTDFMNFLCFGTTGPPPEDN
ncbi:MAG: TetR/AcrR family transcriptional regulator [Candidatus Marinimicrobia bacterium]|nr:TetR/AcrR family transcriptional regulator [Candidatus Neomarinimicrobiota bacterium]MCF7922216.1 TetR/AcrR family transcriptional regulator [Candidatus Neomarinimicrobiota bacterium]